MMHSSHRLKLLLLLLVVTASVAFQSRASIRSVDHGFPIWDKFQCPLSCPSKTTHNADSATCLWSTLVISEDPAVSFGVSLVNGANGKGDGTQNGDESTPFLHPSVSWLSSLSSSADLNQIAPISSFETVHALLRGKEDAENLIQNLPSLNSVTCLGIHVMLGSSSTSEQENLMVAPETAQSVGTLLQETLDATEMIPTNDYSLTIVISLDMPVHLAMLQANCLPKTRTNRQLFHVLQHTKGGGCNSILAEYLYDWSNPFGGTDPLACPSREFCCSLPVSKGNGSCVAGALTALLGLGLEPSDAMGDAQVVASSVFQGQRSDFKWKDGVQQFSSTYSSYDVVVRNEDGLLRKEYIAFGYK